MENENFRRHIQDKFMEHRDECRWWNAPCVYKRLGDYIRANRWFLKRSYNKSKRER